MSKGVPLGREEVTIKDESVSGCMTIGAPVILFVAGYFARNSWAVVSGAGDPIIDDSRVFNAVVGLVILGASLFFCACAVLVLIFGLWKTKMKFYERGLTLHGVGALESIDTPRLLYGDLAHVHITEKHHLSEDPPSSYGIRKHVHKRDLLDVAVDVLFKKKNEKKPEPPKFYENTEYTFRFKLKKSKAPVTFSIILDRANEEIDSVAERLEMEGVTVKREAAAENV